MALPVRRGYKGAPTTTTLSSDISNSTTSFSVVSVTGWPLTFPFFVVVEPGTPREEKMSVTGITSTTLTVATRGTIDDTGAFTHAAGSSIYPVFTATEANEANLVASAMTTKGDLIATDGTTINRLGVGTNTHVLQADSTAANGFKWGQVATAGIADSAVTSAKIADGTIVLGDLAAALQAFLVPTGSINAWSTNSAPTGWQLCDGTAVSRTTYAALFAVIGETYGAGDGTTTFNLPNLKGRAIVGRDAAQTEFDTLAETGGAKTHTLTSAEIPVHLHTISAYSHASTSTADLAHTHTFSGSVTGSGTGISASTNTVGDHVHTRAYGSVNRGTGSTPTTVPVNGGGVPNHDSGGAGSHSHTVSISDPGHGHTYSGTTSGMSANGTHSHTIAQHDAKDTGQTGGGGAHNNLQPYIVLNYIIKH